ncbi:hypothetical protein [Plantactinospora sp. GCM10030261]|uniref:hypothetical protein n=1 Tax=Plantactinospora sp. GCM10030261 TaxID=3273420 RepID=UPI00360C9FF2
MLTNGSATGRYRTAMEASVRGRGRITREDLAVAMLALLEQPDTIRHAVGVAG